METIKSEEKEEKIVREVNRTQGALGHHLSQDEKRDAGASRRSKKQWQEISQM